MCRRRANDEERKMSPAVSTWKSLIRVLPKICSSARTSKSAVGTDRGEHYNTVRSPQWVWAISYLSSEGENTHAFVQRNERRACRCAVSYCLFHLRRQQIVEQHRRRELPD